MIKHFRLSFPILPAFPKILLLEIFLELLNLYIYKEKDVSSSSAKILNTILEGGFFPNQPKSAEVTHVLEKKDDLSKENYRAVSVLFHVSNLLEKIVFNQINKKKQTGFCKNHNTENVLLNITEKWRHALDKGKTVSTVFMDLPKAFDTLNHNLLLA